MDYDNQCGFWIKDTPYIWVEDKKLEKCKRYYILSEDTLIFFDEQLIKIKDINDEEEVKKDIIIPNMNCSTKRWAKNYFLISTFKNLSPILNVRINGINIKEQIINKNKLHFYKIIPPKWSNLSSFYLYYPPFEILTKGYSHYKNGDIIKSLYENGMGRYVQEFLGQKLKGFDKNILFGLLYSSVKNGDNDKIIFEKIKNIYKPKTDFGAWGGKLTKKEITGKAESRIKEIQSVLPSNIKTYLDIGSGNGEISYGIGKHLGVEVIMMDIKDNRDEIFKKEKFLKIDEDQIIKLKSNSVDLITIFQTLHHIKNLDSLMSELKRVIKKDGIIIIREHDCGNKNTAKMIDLEHMMYDIIFENKSYEDSIKEYYARYFSMYDFDSLFEYYKFEVVKHLDTHAKFNETKYYYSVYKVGNKNKTFKIRILDDILKSQLEKLHPAFNFTNDSLDYFDIVLLNFFNMINNKDDPKEQLKKITKSETDYLLQNVFEGYEYVVFKNENRMKNHFDKDYYDLFNIFKKELSNFSEEHIYYFSIFFYIVIDEIIELSGNAMRDNDGRDKIKIVHLKLAIENDAEIKDYKFFKNIDLEDKDVKRYDVLNMDENEYNGLLKSLIKVIHKRDLILEYKIYSNNKDKVITSNDKNAKLLLILMRIRKDRKLGINILRESGNKNPSLNQVIKIYENYKFGEVVKIISDYNRELQDKYIKDNILSIWEISKYFK